MNELKGLPGYPQLMEFLNTIGLSPNILFGKWGMLQFLAIVISILFAKFLSYRLAEPIESQLRGIVGQRRLLRFLVVIYRKQFWIWLSIALWVAYLIISSATWPSHGYFIRGAASLSTVWLVISVLSRLIKNQFLARIIAVVAWFLAALSILGLLPSAREALDAAAFTIGNTRLSALVLIQSSVLLVVLIWGAMLVSQFIGNVISSNEDLSPSVQVLLYKLIRFALLALAVLIALGAVGIDFTALAVFSGAVGIGVGLGLQKIVSNFLSGIILLLDKSIKPGDVIEIDTVSGSTYGWVQHLGARYTSVRTRDGTETLIPNESFIDTPVTNWTHTNKAVRRRLPVGVSYDTDVERAIVLCIEAAEETKRVLKVPKPVCLIKGFGDSSVDLELRFWLNDPEGGVSNVSSQLYLEIWKRFQAEKIEIPFPQRDLNIRSSVPFEIKKPRGKE